jgi:eukaryotic-like serine/threonine-protein kinase
MIVDDRVPMPELTEEMPASPVPPTSPDAQDLVRMQPCRVPDLVGLEAPDAHALARSSGVRLTVSVWETVVGPWGMVLEQLPRAGTRARRGARIRVIVSGRPQAPVPDVRGLPLDTAIEHLSWLGFIPLTTARRRSQNQPVGHILSIRPAAGTILGYGSVVALTVALPPSRLRHGDTADGSSA